MLLNLIRTNGPQAVFAETWWLKHVLAQSGIGLKRSPPKGGARTVVTYQVARNFVFFTSSAEHLLVESNLRVRASLGVIRCEIGVAEGNLGGTGECVQVGADFSFFVARRIGPPPASLKNVALDKKCVGPTGILFHQQRKAKLAQANMFWPWPWPWWNWPKQNLA